MTSVRAFAERILLTDSLEEKLAPPPPGLKIDPPQKDGYRSPDRPGRPAHLQPRKHQEKSAFPSAPQLEQEEHRARLLHFFCNHELLAVELMALALLKFPDAPDAFRRGVFRTIQEEQSHTRWYLDRMAATGMQFGDLPVSPMIWNHIADMESPLDYVSRLSLTFEQANLDYANHYAKILAQVGDKESAHILEKIYKDEIAHVGHGIKWLRRWKQESQSDWDAWHQRLHLPLSPIRAKGMAPFNTEGRKKAGLNDHFISNLQSFQASRGRSPDLYWFNPDAELLSADPHYQTSTKTESFIADLEPAFTLALPTSDDLALVRRPVSEEHRRYLANHHLHLPETAPFSEKSIIERQRKTRSHRPWARVGPHLSKQLTLELRALLPPELTPIPSTARDPEKVISDHPEFLTWVSKPLFGAAGRGLKIFAREQPLPHRPGTAIIEPWVDKILEVSLLFHRRPAANGGLRFLGIVHQKTDAKGKWLASTAHPKPAHRLGRDLAIIVSRDIPQAVKSHLQPALEALLSQHDYEGPAGLDTFIFRTADGPCWQPVCEVNARTTMGRVALALAKKVAPNRSVTLQQVPANQAIPSPNTILLADPAQAHSLVPTLTITPPIS